MSLKPVPPNRVDLNLALSELRKEEPDARLQSRVLDALRPMNRPSLRPRLLIAGALLVASGIAFWPRDGGGLAWAQSQASTARAKRMHQKWFSPDGKLGGEMWADGERMSDYSLDREGNVYIEYRVDAQRSFMYIKNTNISRPPNAVNAATIRRLRRHPLGVHGLSPVDDFLKSTKATVLSQKEEQASDGPRTVYRIRPRYETERISTVYAETETGRIRKIVEATGSWTDIDYPDVVPEEAVSVDHPVVKAVTLFEAEDEKRIVSSVMKKGLGTNNGISLKLAALDQYGTITFMWTGWLPDGKMSKPIRLTGVPCSPPSGSKMFTTSWKANNKTKPPMLGGQRIGAMGVTPKMKVGDRIKELIIPGPHGRAVFRNVPLVRVGSLYDVGLY